jgi:hypothetical protein
VIDVEHQDARNAIELWILGDLRSPAVKIR